MRQTNRPAVDVSLTAGEKAIEAAAALGLAFALVTAFYYWPQLPEKMPVHFDFCGRPDSYGPKSGVMLLPVLAAVTYAVFTVLGRFPQIYNYPVRITEENAARQYAIALALMRRLKLEIVWLVAYGQWATFQVALGRARGIASWLMPVFLAAIVGTSVLYLVQAYRAR